MEQRFLIVLTATPFILLAIGLIIAGLMFFDFVVQGPNALTRFLDKIIARQEQRELRRVARARY